MRTTKESMLKELADKVGANRKFHRRHKDRLNPSLEYIASPAEATLACHGNIGESGYIISKHKKVVGLDKIIGEYAKRFIGGTYFNMYLSPGNSHYFRIPYDGTVEYIQMNDGKAKYFWETIMIGLDNWFGNTKMFAKAIDQNATVGIIVKSKHFSYAMIAVGSLNVNNITIKCDEGKRYRKGYDAGHFSIGSTIVLCFDKSLKKNIDKIQIKDGEKKDIGEDIIKIKGIYEK
jgi:phosphatidylserine decarboxylase